MQKAQTRKPLSYTFEPPPVDFARYGSPFTGNRLQEPMMWRIALARAAWDREIARYHALLEHSSGISLFGHGLGMLIAGVREIKRRPTGCFMPLRTTDPLNGYTIYPREEYVLRSIIEWFGTNCGYCYFNTGLMRAMRTHSKSYVWLWNKESRPQHGINYGLGPLDIILHRCSPKCRRNGWDSFPHFRLRKEFPRKRDLQVAILLHHWFETDQGTTFLLNLEREFKEGHALQMAVRDSSQSVAAKTA